MSETRKPDYGVDSPTMVCGQLVVGLVATGFAVFTPRIFGLQVRWIEIVAALYFLHGAFSMFRYSKAGKLTPRRAAKHSFNSTNSFRIPDWTGSAG